MIHYGDRLSAHGVYTVHMQIPPFDRITVEPGMCGGKPCVRGMRITVRRVLELLATYPDRTELLREYPYLEDEDLNQALRFAAATVDDEVTRLNQVA
jgi:uncharacterized protein (DUF433 family)